MAGGSRFGNELLLLNGALTFLGLWLAGSSVSRKSPVA